MGYIYKTTNIINGHYYIGQKRKDAFDPTYYGSGTILANAIKKYGKENFLIEVLEIADNEILNEREIFYISKFNSTQPEHYNITKGGTGGDTISNHPDRDAIIAKIDRTVTKNQRESRSVRMKKYWKDRINSKDFDHESFKLMCSNRSKEMWRNNPLSAEQKKQRSIQSKLNYINDPDLSSKISASAKKAWKKKAQKYIVKFPDDTLQEVTSLRGWCKDNNHPYWPLYSSLRYNRAVKGWLVKRLDDV